MRFLAQRVPALLLVVAFGLTAVAGAFKLDGGRVMRTPADLRPARALTVSLAKDDATRDAWNAFRRFELSRGTPVACVIDRRTASAAELSHRLLRALGRSPLAVAERDGTRLHFPISRHRGASLLLLVGPWDPSLHDALWHYEFLRGSDQLSLWRRSR